MFFGNYPDTYFSCEIKVLFKSGFRKIPKRILPHESNFIFKLHGARCFLLTLLCTKRSELPLVPQNISLMACLAI